MAQLISKTELNDATPVETPATIVTLASETAAKPSRKAKLKAETSLATADTPPDYLELGIEEAEVAHYEALRLRFRELGRRSTAQVFECGEVVAELQELAPDQKIFTKRAKAVLGLSRRGAENYSSVYRNLKPYRDRLVKIGMIASGLYDLASAEGARVEEVLAACEAGHALTGAQVRTMLDKEDGPSVSPDDGGPVGLRARIAEKTALGVAELMDSAATLLEALLVALEPHRQGKRIVVKEAQRPFIYPARALRHQLEWLTWRAKVESADCVVVNPGPVVTNDRWQSALPTRARRSLRFGQSLPAACSRRCGRPVFGQSGRTAADRANNTARKTMVSIPLSMPMTKIR